MARSDPTFKGEDIIRFFEDNLQPIEAEEVLEFFQGLLAIRPGDEDLFSEIIERITDVLDQLPGLRTLGEVLGIAAQIRELLLWLDRVLNQP